MTDAVVTPNLVFPALDFDLRPAPEPLVEPEPPTRQQKERAARAEYRDMLRTAAARPARGKFKVTDLDDDVCHWPIGSAPYLFCGAGTGCAPYCGKHARIAYR